jgi:F-type H+-transporting ATPase subunit epsilon
MADEIQLRIVTPSEELLDERVTEVTAPGTVGEFGVLPDHATFLSSLEIGRLSYRTARALHHVAVRGGFAEVSNNVMTVLADDARRPADIDVVAVRELLSATEDALAKLSPIDPEYEQVEAERNWALARLEIAAK